MNVKLKVMVMVKVRVKVKVKVVKCSATVHWLIVMLECSGWCIGKGNNT